MTKDERRVQYKCAILAGHLGHPDTLLDKIVNNEEDYAACVGALADALIYEDGEEDSEYDPGWVPVEKGKPEEGKLYLVTYQDGDVGVWRVLNGSFGDLSDVVAYAPLPKGYQCK